MANSKDQLLMKTKSLLRAVLASSDSVKVSELQAEYEMVTLEQLPFKELGYNTLQAFIQAVPDVVIISRDKNGELLCKEAPSTATEHMKHLTKAKKKSSKSKPKQVVRRPKKVKTAFGPPRRGFGRVRGGVHAGGFRGNQKGLAGRLGWGVPARRGGHVVANTTSQGHPTAVGRPTGQSAGSSDGRFISFNRGLSLYTARKVHIVPSNAAQHQMANFGRMAEKNQNTVPNRSQFQQETLLISSVKGLPGRFTYRSNPPRDLFLEPSDYTSLMEQKSNKYSQDLYQLGKYQTSAADRPSFLVKPMVKTSQGTEQQSKKQSSKKCYVNDKVLRERVKQILKNKSNGLFSTKLADEYAAQFNEPAPPQLLNRILKWSDIVTVETISVTNQTILYPSTQCLPKMPQQFTECTISPVVMPKPSERLKVTVTMVENCSNFSVRRMSASFTAMMEKIQEAVKCQLNIISKKKMKVGMYCLAKSVDDDKWYRAQINHKYKQYDEVFCCVSYIDLGSVGTVSSLSLRRLPSDISVLPAQAIKCHLLDCFPIQREGWSAESIDLFKSLTFNRREPKDLLMDVIQVDSEKGCIVKLYDSNQCDIANIMIEKRLALPMPSNAEPAPLVLPCASDWDIFVCYANKTTDITVRFVGEDTSEQLDELEQRLAHFVTSRPKDLEVERDQLKVGKVYMIPANIDEEMYNRVRLIAIHGNKVTVAFLDHGDTDVVEINKLKNIPPECNQLPYQAIPAKLTGLEAFENNDSVNKRLIELTLGKTFVAQVDCIADRVSLTLWDTTDDGVDQNINEMIAMDLNIEELALRLPQRDESIEGYVSYVSEEGHIYFQIQGPGLKALDNLTTLLAETYEKGLTPDVSVKQPEKGQLYCVKYMESWARIEVIDIISESLVLAYFVDFGNIDVIQVSELCLITSKLSAALHLPYQALECILFELPPDGRSWTDKALDRIVDLAPECEVRVMRVVIPDKPPHVELYLPGSNGELMSINKIIFEETALFEEGYSESQFSEVEAVTINSPREQILNEQLAAKALTNQMQLSTGDNSFNRMESDTTSETYITKNTCEAGTSGTPHEPDMKLEQDQSQGVSSNNNVDITSGSHIERQTLEEDRSSKDGTNSSSNDNIPIGSLNIADSQTSSPASSMQPTVAADQDIPPPLELPKSGEEVFVTWIDDPANIWVVANNLYENLCLMHEEMQEYYKKETSKLQESDIVSGQLYAALHEDVWYRALVKSVLADEGKVQVHFVDYGDLAMLDASIIRVLARNFRKLPFLAFRCKLKGLCPPQGHDTWQEESINRIRELIQEKVLTAWIVDTEMGPATPEGDAVPVTLADFSQSSQNVFIHKILIAEGLARQL